MELLWTTQARQDRIAIYGYIEADNPIAALTLDELFSRSAGLLLEHPGLGRKGRVEGTREFVVHPNYLLIYALAGEQVRVLRVLHTARQWPSRP